VSQNPVDSMATKKKDIAVAEMVREVRRRVGLSQEKFVAKLGVSFSTVSRWEHQRAMPSPLALERIRELVEKLGDRGQDILEQYFPEETKGTVNLEALRFPQERRKILCAMKHFQQLGIDNRPITDQVATWWTSWDEVEEAKLLE